MASHSDVLCSEWSGRVAGFPIDRQCSSGDNDRGTRGFTSAMVNEKLEAAFHPRSIAVVGASGNPLSMG
ncbi:MAG: hypothetical protein KAT75_08620, partial [Dehalococcoidia bacterium]|nr:hypothetical protein [Dehalococcoidia bacterium]